MGDSAIDGMVETINRLCGIVKWRSLTLDEKDSWRETVRELMKRGFAVKRRKGVYSVVPVAGGRNCEAPFVFTDMRPNDGMRTLRGDCTTRAMAFIFSGTLTYRQIESMQYELAARSCAAGHHVHRNTRGIWDQIVLRNGYSSLKIAPTKRSRIACVLKGTIHAPIITRSRGHVSVVDESGAIRDTWDCRGGRVYEIFVKNENVPDVYNKLVEDFPKMKGRITICRGEGVAQGSSGMV